MFKKITPIYCPDELEISRVKIENYLLAEKIFHLNDLDELCPNLTPGERKNLIELLSKEKYIKKTEDTLEYDEDKTIQSFSIKEIFSSLVKPEFVSTEKNYIKVNNTFFIGICAVEYPNQVDINWLSRLASEEGNIDFSVFGTPIGKRSARKYLNDAIQKVNVDLYPYNQKGVPNMTLQNKLQSLKEALVMVERGEYKIFRTSLFVVAKGSTLKDAEKLADSIKSALQADGIEADYARNYQEQVLRSIIPLGVNRLPEKNILIPSTSLANFFPFSYSFLQVDPEGIPIGFNEINLPIAKNLWDEDSYSICCLGKTGSGKSFCMKAYLKNEYTYNGTNIVVIDPALNIGTPPEYKAMCKLLDGSYISFNTSSKNIPNIMAVYEKPEYVEEDEEETAEGHFQNEISRVAQLVKKLIGGKDEITSAQEPIIEQAIMKSFEDVGITRETKEFWKKQPPMLDNLYTALRYGLSQNKSPESRSVYEALIRRCQRFVRKGLHSWINKKKAELDLSSQFSVFEFRNTPEEMRPILTAMVMNYVKTKAMGNLDRTLIVIEEAHMFLSDPQLSSFLSKLIFMVRKSNTGIVLVFQDIGQLEGCKEGLSILNNMQVKFLFKTGKTLIKQTAEAFDLNKIEQDYLREAGKGTGILIWGDKHSRLSVVVDEETHRIITTKPSELITRQKEFAKESIEMFYEEKLGHAVSVLSEAREEFCKLHIHNPKYTAKIEKAPQEEQKILLSLMESLKKQKNNSLKKESIVKKTSSKKKK